MGDYNHMPMNMGHTIGLLDGVHCTLSWPVMATILSTSRLVLSHMLITLMLQ